MKIIHKPNQK